MKDKIHTEYKKLYRLRGRRFYRPIPAGSLIHKSAFDRYKKDIEGYVKYSNNFERFIDDEGGLEKVTVIN